MPASLIFRKFNVLPAGIVQGGFVTYTLDPDTGTMTYQASIQVFGNPIDESGPFTVDPSIIKSSGIKLNRVFTVGDVTVKVTKVNQDKTATLSLSIPSIKATGTAMANLKDDVLELSSVNISASVYGFSIAVNAVPAQ